MKLSIHALAHDRVIVVQQPSLIDRIIGRRGSERFALRQDAGCFGALWVYAINSRWVGGAVQRKIIGALEAGMADLLGGEWLS